MPQGMDATGIFTEMKFATMNRPTIRNNVIRMEISPAKEHTKNFTLDDRRQLWYDFAEAFDSQEILDKNNRIVSAKTNISGSKSTVWLHEESDSGIPHLHAIVSRVDERGNINNDHSIHLRAQRAAERIARQRGWITAMHVHETNIPKVSDDCVDALREPAEWSWEGYTERLAAKGYKLYPRKDSKDGIRGYILKKGNTRYKASELGKGRNLTASRIMRTWEMMLHPEKVKQENQTLKRPVVREPAPSAYNENVQRSRTVTAGSSPVREDYTAWQPDRLRAEFEHDGREYRRHIPEKVLEYFGDEFDYRELSNRQDLQGLAMAFFTLVASPYGQVTGGGGGGSRSDLSRERDPKEDEMEFARRCAREASRVTGRQTKNGIRR